MGRLLYGSDAIEFDDRVLAHIQVVAGGKLRRSEPFFVSWDVDDAAGGGRVSLWLSPWIPLRFEYTDANRPTLNPDWLNAMAVSAGSNQGLVLSEEPPPAEPEGKQVTR
ncbi:hypothetical protein BH11ACT4_BH11ACT4_07610 [soil metagenome]